MVARPGAGKLEHLGAGALYAFRCWGPKRPYDDRVDARRVLGGDVSDVDEHGNRFNPNKARPA